MTGANMTIRFHTLLCATLLLGPLAVPAASAQDSPATSSQRFEEARMTGVVEHVDALHRQVMVGGIVYRVAPLTRIVDPLGRKQSDLRLIEAGMHIEFTGEMPARPRDLGTISSIRIIAN